ncbi:MAG: RsmE family RNA methyltransferase [Bacteroidales bacterium]|jgi:16S rRNA (uracil1498-N3)-methyltransferase|nr:RsmE family RNA methyltransferase [Bacteroidales bacterium]
MQVYYSPEAVSGQIISLDQNESHHIAKVMRMQPGDSIYVVDGKGSQFAAKIQGIAKAGVQIAVETCVKFEKTPESLLHIAIAPTKNISRFEWFLEKVTEIGVAEITPLLCENSERKHIKPERLEKIIVAAMKQSKRLYKPVLHDLQSIENVFNISELEKFIAYCEDIPDEQLISHLNPKRKTIVLIGPEGDFSDTELKTAIQSGYKPVALGNYRLRTETAGVVVSQIAQDKALCF